MARVAILVAVFVLACSVAVSTSAKEHCRAIFDAYDASCFRCGLEPIRPSSSVCNKATAANDEGVKACIEWLQTLECGTLDNASFRAHCTVITIYDL